MTVLRNRLFMASSVGHALLDIFNSSGPVLIAVLSVSMGLNNKLVALAIGLYQFAGAISQPLFGWLADRYGGRTMLALSVTWTIGFLTLSIFAAETGSFVLFVIPFIVASFGSAAFHPLGTKFAALSATGRAATGTAIFFLFGQFGLATGPVLTGAIVERFGTIGWTALALFSLPVLLFLWATPMVETSPQTTIAATTDKLSDKVILPAPAEQAKVDWWGIGVLIFHSICRSWAQIGTISFIPKLFQDKGWEPTSYGAIVSTMWAASAVTGVMAGYAADRWGRRQVVFVVMILSVVPLYFLPITNTALVFVLALLVGGLTGAPHSVIVVIAQAMMPGKQATASGLILGLIFGMGAVATLGIGLLADLWSLERALQVGALMALLAALSALVLPSTRQQTEVEAAAEKVAV